MFARGNLLTWIEQGKWVDGSDQMGVTIAVVTMKARLFWSM